jgi:hypothetical protein
MLKGGPEPEAIAEWFEALHIIDRSQTSSAAIKQTSGGAPRPQVTTRHQAGITTTQAPKATPSPDAMDVDGHREQKKCYNCGQLEHI